MPGWSDRSRVLATLEAALLRAGCPHVVRLEFRDRYGSNIEHALEIAAAVDQLRASGHFRIDIVAHSMGGLASRRYLVDYGDHGEAAAATIRRIVFLATPHFGTWAAWFGWGEGALEMRPGSAFLRELARTAIPRGTHAFTVRSGLDLRMFPASSARLPGTSDRVLWSVGHRGLLRRSTALSEVVRVLSLPEPRTGLAS